MIGAIIGDTIGSIYEFDNIFTKDFELFDDESIYTDDSLMTIAVALAVSDFKEGKRSFRDALILWMKKIGNACPTPCGGYGGGFYNWLFNTDGQNPYNSCGNGSAMRASPCGEIAETLEDAIDLGRQSAEITHNHPEGIKGAEAVAACVFAGRKGWSKAQIRDMVSERFGYDLSRNCDQIRKDYNGEFHVTCQDTVPEALGAFLEGEDFEDAIRLAVSLGGDTDTLADITGAVAWAYYYGQGNVTGSMREMAKEAFDRLPDCLKEIVNAWEKHYDGIELL